MSKIKEAPMTDPDARLRWIEDRLALRELVARYGLAIDDHDFAAVGALFTDDARYGREGDEAALLQGRAAIVAALGAWLGGAGPSFHVVHDQILTRDPVDPDTVSGIVTCHAETSHGGAQRVAAIRYRDRYRRSAGGWLIAERRIGFLYFAPVADYPTILSRRDRIVEATGARPADWPAYG